MQPSILRACRLTGLFLALGVSGASAQPQPTPQQPAASVESLTYKQLTARLDEVDYSLQSIQSNIEQFRLDFRSGLGRTAAIRVLDMGVALVRDRASLNRMPRLIGAMNREGRPDWLQKQRKDELMARLNKLIAKHGEHNRAIEGYAADLKDKFGIDIQRFLDAIATQMEQGKNVDQIVSQASQALRNNDNAGFQQAIQQAESGGGGAVQPPTPPRQNGQNDITGVSIDPNDPTKLLVRFADGTMVSVPFTRGPNGELIFTLPNGERVTLPAGVGPGGATTVTLPNGTQVTVGGMAPAGGTTGGGTTGGGTTGGGTTGGGTTGGGTGGLPPGVRQVNSTTLAVTMPDGTERYFPADLTKPGIGTRYLGEKGTRLVEESEEFLDLGSAGQYTIRQGRSVRWRFAATLTGQAPDAGGTRVTFKFSDSSGQGRFTVSGWRILGPDGGQIASGAGEEATAVVGQSGTYRAEFSGTTEWGSTFKIEGQAAVAVQ